MTIVWYNNDEDMTKLLRWYNDATDRMSILSIVYTNSIEFIMATVCYYTDDSTIQRWGYYNDDGVKSLRWYNDSTVEEFYLNGFSWDLKVTIEINKCIFYSW